MKLFWFHHGTILSKPRWSSSDKISIFVVFECLLFRIFFSSSKIFLWLKFLKQNEFILAGIPKSSRIHFFIFKKIFFFQKKVNAQIKGCFTIEALIPFHPFLLLNPSLLLSIETVHWPMSQHSFLGYFSLGPFDFDDFRRPSPSILVVFTTGTFL